MSTPAPARRPRPAWIVVASLLGLSGLLCALGAWQVGVALVNRAPAAPGGTLTIVSDLPLASYDPPIVRAMRLRLEQAGGRGAVHLIRAQPVVLNPNIVPLIRNSLSAF